MTVPVLITDLSTTALLNAPSGEDAPSTLDNIQRAHAAFIAKLRDESQTLANKDASGGYAGLTLWKLNLRNAANTFTSFLTNAATAARTWAMQDRDGTVALTSDITGGTLAGSFTTLAASGSATFPAGAQITGAALLGYGPGAGGTVTQATSKDTAVTLNKPCGQIAMNGAALAANTTVAFIFNNSLLGAYDVIKVSVASPGNGSYIAWQTANGVGTSAIAVRNLTAGSLSDVVYLNFTVVKGGAL